MNVLFLGDSITDCNHCFSSDNLGFGYVKMIHELYMTNIPSQHIDISNGGTDGFTFPRILRKWNQLYADKSWDIVCILAGINETGYLMGLPDSEETVFDQYIKRSSTAFLELLSSMLLHNVKKIVILTPFLFEQPAYLHTWKPALKKVCCMIHDTCRDFTEKYPLSASIVSIYSLQNYFDQLILHTEPSALSEDGIHLTEFGHQKLGSYLYQIFSLLSGS